MILIRSSKYSIHEVYKPTFLTGGSPHFFAMSGPVTSHKAWWNMMEQKISRSIFGTKKKLTEFHHGCLMGFNGSKNIISRISPEFIKWCGKWV